MFLSAEFNEPRDVPAEEYRLSWLTVGLYRFFPTVAALKRGRRQPLMTCVHSASPC